MTCKHFGKRPSKDDIAKMEEWSVQWLSAIGCRQDRLLNVALKTVWYNTNYCIIYTIICLKSVCLSAFANCRSQFLLDRLGKCLLTVRIVWQYILSRVRVSVRPSIFLYAKNFQNLWEIGWPVHLFISMSRRSAIVSPASERVRPTTTESWLGAPKQRTATVVCGGVHECAYIRACVRAWCVCNKRW